MVVGLAVLSDVVLVGLGSLRDAERVSRGTREQWRAAYLVGRGTGDELVREGGLVLLRSSLRNMRELPRRPFVS